MDQATRPGLHPPSPLQPSPAAQNRTGQAHCFLEVWKGNGSPGAIPVAALRQSVPVGVSERRAGPPPENVGELANWQGSPPRTLKVVHRWPSPPPWRAAASPTPLANWQTPESAAEPFP